MQNISSPPTAIMVLPFPTRSPFRDAPVKLNWRPIGHQRVSLILSGDAGFWSKLFSVSFQSPHVTTLQCRFYEPTTEHISICTAAYRVNHTTHDLITTYRKPIEPFILVQYERSHSVNRSLGIRRP